MRILKCKTQTTNKICIGIIVFLNEPLFIYCNLIAIKFDLEFGFYFFLFSLLLN